MRTLAIGTTVLVLALGACASHRQPANQPSSNTTTTTGAPILPGSSTSNGISPWNGDPTVPSTSPAPASPMDSACPDGQPSPTATDLESCLKSCRGLDSLVPLGSQCASEYGSCAAKCDAKF